MAKNNHLMTFCANTIQENERMLRESCYKYQVEIKGKEDIDKLLNKINYICELKTSKEEVLSSSTWSNKNVKNYTYGPIRGFPSGSWWGIRMDCSRDRVHDPFDDNIQNGPFGVTSICTSNSNLSEDVDCGNSLTLTGQKYLCGEFEEDPLIKNYKNQIPVRLVRSYNLSNEFAPKTGYRYDGLYTVVSFWIGVTSDSQNYYKFALLRLNAQEPSLWHSKQTATCINNSTSLLHTMSSVPQNSLKLVNSNVYEFKKYSHGFESVVRSGKLEKSNGISLALHSENKKIDEREKNMCESAIVTRHVSKKVNPSAECISNMPNITIAPENKSLTLIGNQVSKTHNTNISIRTGLYNSSHSTQQDNKKNISSPFCRNAKALNILKSNQHTENCNMSIKEKNRNSDGKNEFPKRVNYISFHAIESKSEKEKSTKDINPPVDCSKNDTSSPKSCVQECNAAHKEGAHDFMASCNSLQNLTNTPTNMLNITNCMYKNEISVHKMSHKEVQEMKSLDSIDSLTPDKILNLINKKGHPLSKLLMGNMIGLPSEQFIALQTGDITTSPDVKDKLVEQKNIAEDVKKRTSFEAVSDDLTVSRCYKFRRRRKLSRRIMNKPEMMKYNKVHNEKLKKGCIQSADILGKHLTSFTSYDSQQNLRKLDVYNDPRNKNVQQNQMEKEKANFLRSSTKNIKKTVESKSEARIHLQAMRTINSSIKKHINKKQRREITNLLIDAKIGPKIRGPRYRRLRCIDNTFVKKTYERSNSTISILNSCKINSKRTTFKHTNAFPNGTNCKRVKSKQSSNRNKRSVNRSVGESKIRNLAVSRKIDKNRLAKGTFNNVNNENNDKEDNNEKSRCSGSRLERAESKDDISVIKNRKRKLIQTVYTDPKCNKVEEQLNKGFEDSESKPSKTDAVTQCSLIREPLTRNLKLNNIVENGDPNDLHLSKINYADLEDTKSEVCKAVKLDNENTDHLEFKDNGKCISCTETVCNVQHRNNGNVSLNSTSGTADKQECYSPERASAFVPVNVLDSDLKIARLRSIGFKPINFSDKEEGIFVRNKGKDVLKHNVAEKYDKYTNEENDIVVYMDDKLQYQDIENEDKNSLSFRRSASSSEDKQLNRATGQRDLYNNAYLEQDLESPWHGWKKVVTNKNTYWVGW